MPLPVTRWTLIVAAAQAAESETNEALNELCGLYWYPVYAYIRRMGSSPVDAEDLTQDFFTRFLEKRHVRLADRQKGRFRSFLLTSLRHFIVDQQHVRLAEKRGGKAVIIPLNTEMAEKWYSRCRSAAETPERVFEREWAFTLIKRASSELEMRYAREGRSDYFQHLKSFLPGNHEEVAIADVARKLESSEGAVKVAVHRLRRRFGETFRSEIALLVMDPASIDDEIRSVLDALRS